ncbi:MAG: acyl-CoA dehydrogenase family protein [Acidobacteriota bacterium]
MDFSIPIATQSLLSEVGAFLREEVYPLEPRLFERGFGPLLTDLGELRSRVKAKGWWLPQAATSEGGMGLSLVEYGLVSAELGRTPLGHYLFNCQAPDAGNMEILRGMGSQRQKEKFLRPLLEGRIRSCFAMTEPDRPGSNPVWMGTRAEKRDGDYVIDGHKWFVSAADGAAFAIVMAVTHPEAEPHRRASMILVPTDTPGFKRVRNIPCMGHRGESWASHGEIRFESCRVPAANLLGREGQGFAIAQQRLGPGRIHHCMRWLGICERAFELMCKRAAGRELAPGRPLGSRQFVQDWIATSRMEINSARLSVLQAAWLIDQKSVREAQSEISCVKFQVANTLRKVLDRAIQTHGGLGVTDDTPLAFFYRNERAARIYDGPDEVHKIAVARRILREWGMKG